MGWSEGGVLTQDWGQVACTVPGRREDCSGAGVWWGRRAAGIRVGRMAGSPGMKEQVQDISQRCTGVGGRPSTGGAGVGMVINRDHRRSKCI